MERHDAKDDHYNSAVAELRKECPDETFNEVRLRTLWDGDQSLNLSVCDTKVIKKHHSNEVSIFKRPLEELVHQRLPLIRKPSDSPSISAAHSHKLLCCIPCFILPLMRRGQVTSLGTRRVKRVLRCCFYLLFGSLFPSSRQLRKYPSAAAA